MMHVIPSVIAGLYTNDSKGLTQAHHAVQPETCRQYVLMMGHCPTMGLGVYACRQ